jgi:hypothetical protein
MITNALMRTPPEVTVADFLQGIPAGIGKMYANRKLVELT